MQIKIVRDWLFLRFKFVWPYCYLFFPMVVFYLNLYTTNKTILVTYSTYVLNKYTKSGLYNNIPVNPCTTNCYGNPQDRLPHSPCQTNTGKVAKLLWLANLCTREMLKLQDNRVISNLVSMASTCIYFGMKGVLYVEITNLIKQCSLCTFFNHIKRQLV